MKLGAVVRIDGVVCELVSSYDGPATVLWFRPVNIGEACPECGQLRDYHFVEGAQNFQDRVKPVSSLPMQPSEGEDG